MLAPPNNTNVPARTRTPSPELPPPPPTQDQEVLENDTPLPPPPEEDSKTALLGSRSRTSPATIAAKGAPGWERFLGGASSSVTFTSEEARKFRRTKDKNRARAQDLGPKSLPFNLNKDGLKPLQPAKSSPSLNDKIPPNNKQQWWKASMDSLRMSSAGVREDSVRVGGQCPPAPVTKDQVVSHSHSSSDSGLSSLSGRTSCMSPMSVVSTGSSASSGSSRASLRSASIVSSSTIPLDEDDEETEEEANMMTVRRNMVKQGQEDTIQSLAMELFSEMTVNNNNVLSLFGE